MKSNIGKILKDLDETIDRRLEASGQLLSNAYQDEIRSAGLVDTGHWLGSVTHVKDGNEVRAGTPVEGYPLFLERGFIHYRSGELVGPYRPLTRAASNSEGQLREIWSKPMGR